jgi:hypothetical protein
LALGLKKETADMCLRYIKIGWIEDDGEDIGTIAQLQPIAHPPVLQEDIPAWSLHRQIEMMPEEIDAYPINSDDDVKETYYLSFNKWLVNYKCDNVYKECHESINLFSNIISMYEWLIKEGYFNKEYLEE